MARIAKPWICTRCANSLTRFPVTVSYTTANLKQRRAYTAKVHAQDGRPFRMAVIGSGPAGFYTAYKVMSKIQNSVVDMYEQLPVPFGLVRFGVAPDHHEVKNCQDKFGEVAESPRFNFIGNVSISDQAGALPLRFLLPHYDAILFAYGASRDRTLGIEGENTLKGIFSARAFVGWYNGLPEYSELAPDLTLGEEAVVIGQGNVALDVARILLQDPEILKETDITTNAIQKLRKSRVQRVKVVGRRGPMQGAFTIKEVRELMKFSSVAFHPVDRSLIPEDITKLPRPTRRIIEVLKKGSGASVSTAPKSWSLDFCLSPKSFIPNTESSGRLGSVSFEKTTLDPDPFVAGARAIGTNEIIEVPAALAFRSIGYKSEALSEFTKLGIPFNDRSGTIPNDHLGRVVDNTENWTDQKRAKHLPGMYCAGWVKRGPTGVIASTMDDAFSTADSIAMDWHGKVPFLNPEGGDGLGWDGVRYEAEKRGFRRVSWEDWKKIDAAEKSNGQKSGKVREKFTNVADMLAVLD
ncbi:related to NADPH:adrenodoxin oxidoreductase, mitochondrial precursor [Rhynchosporium agropyri]|uniref:NADPH:adrenodoxin oxidoreductase, mitochondrial n=1 Tax=Rhynchosporium agropyri TaxID=914238 RepID=A0A1E1L6L2_9HELO|nr:related to NADPH:adrenodoxin oxidoreductase, mitochondrial precursor [Rhynchosporium agropyri]